MTKIVSNLVNLRCSCRKRKTSILFWAPFHPVVCVCLYLCICPRFPLEIMIIQGDLWTVCIPCVETLYIVFLEVFVMFSNCLVYIYVVVLLGFCLFIKISDHYIFWISLTVVWLSDEFLLSAIEAKVLFEAVHIISDLLIIYATYSN